MGLGSFPVPNTATEFKEILDGRLIADVTYRIDASGLREIPAAVQGRPHKVAFFGCSFMFGHGVENDQTLPYYFVQDARGTFEGFNFAGEGWGPHQMLREIETGFVRRVAGAPDLAIYEAIPDHLRRVAGRAPWEDGPKYELCRGREACYSGPFHSAYYEICRRWLDKSWTVKFIENHCASLSRPSDIPLFLAVLKRTRSLLEENGTRFVIVLWDQNELAKTMMKTLRANQFDVVALSSVVPESDLRKHPLTQLDRHPSPATNKAIATYLWEQVGRAVGSGAVTGEGDPGRPGEFCTTWEVRETRTGGTPDWRSEGTLTSAKILRQSCRARDEVVLVVKSVQDGVSHNLGRLVETMPMASQMHWENRGRIRNAWSQGGVWSAAVVMRQPRHQSFPKMLFRQRDNPIQALTP
jgi:hypothetical protein